MTEDKIKNLEEEIEKLKSELNKVKRERWRYAIHYDMKIDYFIKVQKGLNDLMQIVDREAGEPFLDIDGYRKKRDKKFLIDRLNEIQNRSIGIYGEWEGKEFLTEFSIDFDGSQIALKLILGEVFENSDGEEFNNLVNGLFSDGIDKLNKELGVNIDPSDFTKDSDEFCPANHTFNVREIAWISDL